MPLEKSKTHLKEVTVNSPSEAEPEHSALAVGEKPRVLFDVDSVIGNLVQVFISAIEAADIRKLPQDWKPRQFDVATDLGLTKSEEKRMYEMLQRPGVAEIVHPYPGAVEGVKKVAGIADVFFVTSPMPGSQTWTYDRSRWLIQKFGEVLGSKWVYTEYKYVVYGDILVDDKPEHCTDFKKAWPGSIALRWLPPGMPVDKRLINVDSWDMVYMYVEQYAKQKKLWMRK